MGRAWPGYVLYQNNPQNVPNDVGDVQDILSVERTEVYGPTTEQCVTQYQRSHGIGQTGQVGQETWTSLFSEPDVESGLGVNAASWAKGEVGVTEEPIGSNWGPRVSEYLLSCGITYPAAWCAAFVNWCYEREAQGVGVDNPLPGTASCSALYDWAEGNGLLVTAPRQGDIFLCIGGDTGHYHTGFVAADPVNGYFETTEGNSNYDGSANGYEVVYRSPGREVGSCDYVRI